MIYFDRANIGISQFYRILAHIVTLPMLVACLGGKCAFISVVIHLFYHHPLKRRRKKRKENQDIYEEEDFKRPGNVCVSGF